MTLLRGWEAIVVGGGITGAGVFRELSALGIPTLLVERSDFATGTSSRSSKLVHGGLRYLKQAQFKVTLDSVTHRERLLKEAPGMVEPLDFLLPIYRSIGPSRIQMHAGLSLYDFMARKKRHAYLDEASLARRMPQLKRNGLSGGFRFEDAQVDDARLVLRLIREGLRLCTASRALHYTKVDAILRDVSGRVTGIRATDTETGETTEHAAPLVINATGAQAEDLHPSPRKHLHLRPLRGSHLVFPASLARLDAAISMLHPEDRRPVFLIPWEGALVLGTTDLDLQDDTACEPRISEPEIDYLLEAVTSVFPDAGFSRKTAISSYAGIRPVLSAGGKDPSRESREHVVWRDRGLVTVTGGKLTTFRKLAWDTLEAAGKESPLPSPIRNTPVFTTPVLARPEGVSPTGWERLCARYGDAAGHFRNLDPALFAQIPGTRSSLAEVVTICRSEPLRHLDDLMLRRLRLGLLLPEGGLALMAKIRTVAEPELDWDDSKWEAEIRRYGRLWRKSHAVDAGGAA